MDGDDCVYTDFIGGEQSKTGSVGSCFLSADVSSVIQLAGLLSD